MNIIAILGWFLILSGLSFMTFIIVDIFAEEITDDRLESSEWITYNKLYQCNDGLLFSVYIQLFKEDGSAYWTYAVHDEYMNELYFLDVFTYTEKDFNKFYNVFDTAITWLKVC